MKVIVFSVGICLCMGVWACDRSPTPDIDWGDSVDEVEEELGEVERIPENSDRHSDAYSVAASIFGVEEDAGLKFNQDDELKGIVELYETDSLSDAVSTLNKVVENMSEYDSKLDPAEDVDCTVEKASDGLEQIEQYIQRKSVSEYEEEISQLFRVGDDPPRDICNYRQYYDREPDVSVRRSTRVTYRVSLRPVVANEIDEFRLAITAIDRSKASAESQRESADRLLNGTNFD